MADVGINITVREDGSLEVKKLGKELDELSKEGKEAGKDLDRLGKEGKDAGKDLSKLGKEGKDAGKDLDRLGKESRRTGKDIDRLGKEGKDAGKDLDRLGKEGKDAGKDLSRLGKESRRTGKDIDVGMKKAKASTEALTASMGLLKIGITAITGTLGIGLLIRGIEGATTASNDFEASLLGVTSVAKAFNISAMDATDAAKELASDGLISVADAATSLKNLLARGFGLDEAIKLLNAFKDSGAFGRQAALSLGQAIRGATEGLKNENSILVDNAGITKNVSEIWKDYAKSINVGVGSLTKAQKRQAELNGILEEARPFLGDAARLTETYQGQTLALNASILKLNDTIGTQLKTVLAGAVESLNDTTESMTSFLKSTLLVQKVAIGFRTTFKQLNPLTLIDQYQRSVDAINRLLDSLGLLDEAQPTPFTQSFIQVNELRESLVSINALIAELGQGGVSGGELPVITGLIQTSANVQLELQAKINEARVSSGLAEIDFTKKKNEEILKSDTLTSKQREAALKQRATLAFEQVTLIANSQTDLDLKDSILQKVAIAKFKQTTNDKVAIEQFTNNLLFEARIAADQRQIDQAVAADQQERDRVVSLAEFKRKKLEDGAKQEIKGQRIVTAARRKFLEDQKRTEDQLAQDRISTASFIANSALAQNKKFFNISKAANIATATMDGIGAVQKAWNAAPPPFNIPLVALVGAATAANVQKIASAKFGGAGAKASTGGGGGGGGRSPKARAIQGLEFERQTIQARAIEDPRARQFELDQIELERFRIKAKGDEELIALKERNLELERNLLLQEKGRVASLTREPQQFTFIISDGNTQRVVTDPEEIQAASNGLVKLQKDSF